MEEIASLLTEKYGYRYTHRQAIKRLTEQLRAAAPFFKETKPGYFRFISTRHFIGHRKHAGAQSNIDLSYLSKDKNKAFTDILLALNAIGQRTATQNLCNQTGFKRSRIFQGVKDVQRYNIRVILETFDTQSEAEKVSKEIYFKNHILSKVIQNDENLFELHVTLGNNFTGFKKDVLSDGATRQLKDLSEIIAELKGSTIRNTASILNKGKIKARQTTVFNLQSNLLYSGFNIRTGTRESYVLATFLNADSRAAFENSRAA